MIPVTRKSLLLVVFGFALCGFYFSLLRVNTEESTTNCTPQITKLVQEPDYKNFNTNNNKFSNISEPESFPDHYTHDDPTNKVVIRTYSNHRSPLPALIGSLASNDYVNLHVFLVDTVGDFNDLPLFAELYNSLYGREFVHVSDVTPEYARKRFPLFTTPDFGYLQTDLEIERLSTPESKYQCSYFIATNGDNLYSRSLIYLTLEHMRANIDLIGFHFLSHYCYEESESFRPRPGCYSQHYTEFKLQRIDIGAALIRKERLLEKDANFIINELKRDPTGVNVQVYPFELSNFHYFY